ncbi:MAG: acetyl-CoA carboxylase biotin carboxylase subunit [Oscillospiraceae bacterium]|nr:acetyl-CoA carboxylase biotin carboxylase subunit [Oscillospiraceae bacterium]
MLKKVLIANRGEIAVRVIRACRDMGVGSVAVYAQEDKNSLHVQLADERICIGSGGAKNSYLNQDRLIMAALNTGADAVHPGYGFLSENAEFARKCREYGLIFIGPDPDVMDAMGNKSHARAAMKAAGVPVIPGSDAVTDADEAFRMASEIGYPIMIKAAFGGGGRGMRAVTDPEEFKLSFELAQHESASAFGEDAMYLERLIESPRHVEVQIMADAHGNVVALGDRDCSVQRNHQKLIEESPSPAVNAATRKKMYEAAVLAAKTVGYTNAGTVEFILDRTGAFYFMEMNTRIQVEHPVTEMVTGVDLVTEQLRVAAGEELSFTQQDVELRGHAIECRINAEIPEKNFMPSPGKITVLHLPGGAGVRVDTAIYTGYIVPPDYDSMIAKIIVHGLDRDAAIRKMRTALNETLIKGVQTNLDFQFRIMHNKVFCDGRADTGFVEQFIGGGK